MYKNIFIAVNIIINASYYNIFETFWMSRKMIKDGVIPMTLLGVYFSHARFALWYSLWSHSNFVQWLYYFILNRCQKDSWRLWGLRWFNPALLPYTPASGLTESRISDRLTGLGEPVGSCSEVGYRLGEPLCTPPQGTHVPTGSPSPTRWACQAAPGGSGFNAWENQKYALGPSWMSSDGWGSPGSARSAGLRISRVYPPQLSTVWALPSHDLGSKGLAQPASSSISLASVIWVIQ